MLRCLVDGFTEGPWGLGSESLIVEHDDHLATRMCDNEINPEYCSNGNALMMNNEKSHSVSRLTGDDHPHANSIYEHHCYE